jgi:hypothetical protein
MDRLRSIATAWVLKCFKDMGGKDLSAEEDRMRQDDKYLSEWLAATNFRKIQLPESLHFSTPDAVIPVEVGEDEVNISITKWSVGNNGIGAYEFWGAKAHDHGTDYAEVEEITCDAKDSYTKWYIENYPFDIEVESLPEAEEPDMEYEPETDAL